MCKWKMILIFGLRKSAIFTLNCDILFNWCQTQSNSTSLLTTFLNIDCYTWIGNIATFTSFTIITIGRWFFFKCSFDWTNLIQLLHWFTIVDDVFRCSAFIWLLPFFIIFFRCFDALVLSWRFVSFPRTESFTCINHTIQNEMHWKFNICRMLQQAIWCVHLKLLPIELLTNQSFV